MAADLTDEALRSMVGATSPRLQLELMIGRILVELSGARIRPSSGEAEAGSAGHSAAPSFGGSSGFNEPSQDGPQILGEDGKPLTGAALAREQLRRSRAQEQVNKLAQAPKQQAPQKAEGAQAQAPQQASASQAQTPQRPEPALTLEPAPTSQSAPAPESQPEPKAEAAPAEQKQAASSSAPGNVTANLHGKWDQFVEAVRVIMPSSAFLIGEHAKLISEDSSTVILGFANQGLANVFLNRHQDTALKAIQVVTGVSKTIQVQVGGQPASSVPAQPPHGNQEPANSNSAHSRNQTSSRQGFNRANNGREHAANRAAQDQSAPDDNEDTAWPTVRAVPNTQPRTPQQQAGTQSRNVEGQLNSQAGKQGARAEQARSSAAEPDQPTRPHVLTEPSQQTARPQDTARPQESSHSHSPTVARPQAVPEPPQETAPTSQFEESDYDFDTGGANMDDADAENSNLVGLPLVERMFGATIIEDTSEGNK